VRLGEGVGGGCKSKAGETEKGTCSFPCSPSFDTFVAMSLVVYSSPYRMHNTPIRSTRRKSMKLLLVYAPLTDPCIINSTFCGFFFFFPIPTPPPFDNSGLVLLVEVPLHPPARLSAFPGAIHLLPASTCTSKILGSGLERAARTRARRSASVLEEGREGKSIPAFLGLIEADAATGLMKDARGIEEGRVGKEG
jgi:hypothetical protein